MVIPSALIEKNCDLIILNKITKKNNVFGSDYNNIIMISSKKIVTFKKMTKTEVEKFLVNKISISINKFKCVLNKLKLQCLVK